MKTKLLFALLALLSLLTPSYAADSAAKVEPATSGKTVRLLTVGNSFSQNATRYLGDLAKADGNTLIVGRCDVGGSPLELHWGKVVAHDKDPMDPAGLYSKVSLKQQLKSQPWDYVTIQQASIKSHDISTYRPFAQQLAGVIRQQAPQAKLLMHETWAYRVDDPRFLVKEPKPGEPKTQEEMYQNLSNAYRTVASEIGATLIPVGDAFHQADNDPQWQYKTDEKFDPKTAKTPELPNQAHSLHVGWKWGKSKTTGKLGLATDGHHASVLGQYLGGCVWYEVLFGQSPVGNKFVPQGVSAEDARYLQDVAHQAVVAEKARAK